MNPAFLALGIANPGLLPLAFMDEGRSTPWYRRTAVESMADREARELAQAQRRAAEDEAFAAWRNVPGNELILAMQKQTLARLYRERSEQYARAIAEINAEEEKAIGESRRRETQKLWIIAGLWTGAATVVTGVIAWMGAPWVLSAFLFGALMILLRPFLKASQEDEYSIRERYALKRYDAGNARPSLSGAHPGPRWTYPVIDPLPGAEVQS